MVLTVFINFFVNVSYFSHLLTRYSHVHVHLLTHRIYVASHMDVSYDWEYFNIHNNDHLLYDTVTDIFHAF